VLQQPSSLGRALIAGDCEAGAPPAVVLGHDLWTRTFASDAGIVGRTIELNRRPFTVVGVASPTTYGGGGLRAGYFAPISAEPLLRPNNSRYDKGLWLSLIGRRSDGAALEQVRAELAVITAQLDRERSGRTTILSVERARPMTVLPRDASLAAAAVVMTAFGFILLIACSNVANLLLARASNRRQEMAIRLALGARRGRIIRQLLTESALLAMAGGALGFLFGIWGRDLLWSYRPMPNNFVELTLDSSVVAFGIAISVLTGVVFGIAPALHASRSSVGDTLKDSRASGRSGGAALRNALVVGQMALSLVALAAAALFLRSIQQAYAIDPGFDASKVAVVSVSAQQARYDQTRTERLYRDVRERLSTVRGIESVSWAANAPLWAKLYRHISIEGRPQSDGPNSVLMLINTIDVGYFRTLAVALRRGREFGPEDRADSRAVAIVNDTMASKYWPGQEAVGRHVQLDGETVAREVVGVVNTTKYQTLGEAPQPCVFVPLSQRYSDAMVLYVRTVADPDLMLATVQREVRALAPDVPLTMASSVQSLLRQSLWMVKFGVGLLAAFGMLALGLASVGIYGVIAYSVAQRTREMGLRIALGADASAVRRLVFRQAMTLVAAGLVVGLAGALLIGRAMTSLLYGVSGADAVSLTSASLVLLLVAAVASYLPARRAARIDPVISLREA
jgi:predicted permease